MLKKWRLRRLFKSYRRIALLEEQLEMADNVQKAMGVPRQVRRRFKRDCVNGGPNRTLRKVVLSGQ